MYKLLSHNDMQMMNKINLILRHNNSSLRLFQLGRMSKESRYLSTFQIQTTQESGYIQSHATNHIINFGLGQPSPSLLPLQLLKEANTHCFLNVQNPELLQYGAAKGYNEFRKTLSTFLYDQKIITLNNSNQLCITAGNSQAIAHAAIFFMNQNIHANKRVFVEDPSYFLAFELFRELGLDICAIPIAEHGVDVNALEDRLEAGDIPVFLYTIPFYQNPTGTSLSPEHCNRLIDLAIKYDFNIISDEPYNLLVLDDNVQNQKEVKSLASYDKSGRVISLGSFSKILAPGLRLGWAHGKADTIDKFSRIGVYRSGGGQNPMTAAMIHSVLTLNQLQPHILHLCSVFKSRKDAMLNALSNSFSEDQFTKPSGGYFIWLNIGSEINTTDFLSFAMEKYQVAFTPGERCSIIPHHFSTYLRLSYAFYSEDEIQEGIKRLVAALEAYQLQ